MDTNTYFTFRCSLEERNMIRELARNAYRKDSDLVRVLVRGAYQILMEQEERQGSQTQSVKEPQPA